MARGSDGSGEGDAVVGSGNSQEVATRPVFMRKRIIAVKGGGPRGIRQETDILHCEICGDCI